MNWLISPYFIHKTVAVSNAAGIQATRAWDPKAAQILVDLPDYMTSKTVYLK